MESQKVELKSWWSHKHKKETNVEACGHKHKLPPLGVVDKHLAMEFQCSQVITSQTKKKDEK
jgi:hypothetical protein